MCKCFRDVAVSILDHGACILVPHISVLTPITSQLTSVSCGVNVSGIMLLLWLQTEQMLRWTLWTSSSQTWIHHCYKLDAKWLKISDALPRRRGRLSLPLRLAILTGEEVRGPRPDTAPGVLLFTALGRVEECTRESGQFSHIFTCCWWEKSSLLVESGK